VLRVLPGMTRWRRAFHQRRLRQHEQRYRDQLDVLRGRLAELLTAEQTALAEQHPDPSGWLRLASTTQERLWQSDPRQLAVRLGTTPRPSSLIVHVPSQPDRARTDPLVEAAHKLAASSARLPEAPLLVPLGSRLAVRGPRQQVIEATRALLAQLTSQCSAEQLRLAIVFAAAELGEWRWARWLPHVHTATGLRRLGHGPFEACDLALVADAHQRDAALAAARCVYLLDDNELLPEDCATVLDVDAELRGWLTVADQPPVRIGRVDTATTELAEKLARALAGRIQVVSGLADGVVEVEVDGTRRVLSRSLQKSGR
jgi:DNA segregation ATPase FtsK/SpoIIIE-like protein